MQVKSIAVLPSLSYNLSLRPIFCLFLNGRLRQVLLYIANNMVPVALRIEYLIF